MLEGVHFVGGQLMQGDLLLLQPHDLLYELHGDEGGGFVASAIFYMKVVEMREVDSWQARSSI